MSATLTDLLTLRKKLKEADQELCDRIDELSAQVAAIPYQKGDQGEKGDPGQQGVDGKAGKDGEDGKDGERGPQGVSVIDSSIAFDNHLTFTMSDGSELDAGELPSLDEMAQHITSHTSITTGSGLTNPLTENIDGGGYSIYNLATLDIDHTAAENDDHAFEIDVHAGGYGDVKAVDIVYETGAITTGTEEGVILINIDESEALGGDVWGVEVLATEGGADLVGALLVGGTVHPLEQLSGSFAGPDTILVNAVDETVNLSGGGGSVDMFVADNDTVTVGSTAKFEEIELLFNTTATGNGIAPTFEYSTGVGTWGSFVPTDGTNGCKNNGVILWLDSDIPTWAVGTGGEYLIRITRTRNNVSVTPNAETLKILSGDLFYWDKDGHIHTQDIDAADIEARSFHVYEAATNPDPALPFFEWSGTTTVTTANAILPELIVAEPTIDIQNGGFAFGMGFLFRSNTDINWTGGAALGPFYTLADQTTYTLDQASNRTLSISVNTLSAAEYRSIGAGNLTVTTLNNHSFIPSIDTGVTVDNWDIITVAPAVNGGDVGLFRGIYFPEDFVKNVMDTMDHGAQITMGDDSFTGRYGIYQGNDQNNRNKWGGAQQWRIQNFTGTSATLGNDDHHFVCTHASANQTITLPAASTSGREYIIKSNNSFGTVTINRAGSDLIDGATSHVLVAQYDYVRLIPVAGDWYITGTG